MTFGIAAGTLFTVGASVAGGAIAASGARSAANTQANAAREASQVQREIADQQVGLQREQFNRVVELQEPFRRAGLAGQNRLMYLLGLADPRDVNGDARVREIRGRLRPQYTTDLGGGGSLERTDELDRAVLAELGRDPDFGSLMRNFTMADYEADPGYQFRLGEGERSINRFLSSRGLYNSGRAGRELTRYGQGLASEEFGNAFNRFQVNRSNRLQPLQSLSGMAQSATNTMGGAGQNFASGASGALGAYGQGAANNITGAGNAIAAGRVGGANAWTNAIGQGVSAYQQNQLLNALRQPRPSFGTSGMDNFYYGNGTSGD